MSRFIDAEALYRWIKAECNPYGNPTLDYETGCKILDRISLMDGVDSSQIEAATLFDYKGEYEKLMALPNCNDCWIYKHCKYLPACGGYSTH